MMTDDIVTRLRELADAFDDDDISHDQSVWMRSAADEIERLRAQIKLLKGTENFEPCSRVDPCEMCKEMIQKGEA
ncbi:MAG: hypothetical protein EBV21_01005 [Betaproteobacteria bacterium]|nr:hypothetical protein [Betaproteobacteria bacterium]